MAIDQTPSNSPAQSTDVAAIDNEFPTYRAVSRAAVLSLVFGIGSVFCFADLLFLLMSVASVALGLYALKSIRRFPEILTGAGLARFGIGTGLLFGLTSISQLLSTEIGTNIDAGRFARFYVEVVKDKPISEALWYQQALAYRKERTPDELVDELKKAKSQNGGDVYTDTARPIQLIKERLDGGKKGDMAFDSIESKVIDGLTTYANALIKLDLKPSPEFPQTEEYALFRMVKGTDEWMVREVLFPYTPKSAVAASERKHDDDGHGH